MSDAAPYRIFLIAGEPSGDALGAKMMQGLKLTSSRSVEFFGVGGPLMEAEGLFSLFPMEELTVMGLFEVLPKLPLLLRRIRETAEAAQNFAPDILITIDAPDFSFRVAKKLTNVAFPKVHYVAPSVWAWRPGRAQKIAPLYDHLLTLLPFEPPYFEKVGLPATFIGHSVVETGADKGEGAKFRQTHDIGTEEKLLMLLPGSRRGEVARHLPLFEETVRRLKSEMGDVRLVVPVIGRAAEMVREAMKSWEVEPVIVTGEVAKFDAMAAADVALAASGTVGLELALAELPTVIAYRMNALTAWIARRIVKLDYVNLVNILMKREVVPEFLLENCRPENLARATLDLFRSEEKRGGQIADFRHAMVLLGKGAAVPGVRAAEVILEILQRKTSL
ncbi:MAG: lipid-A-disaccharide synthase [Alphaproteobacteria bacterium]|nr:MAG: lipid-A-disaccharide synthase [Alphaproteobacteria bacterium]